MTSPSDRAVAHRGMLIDPDSGVVMNKSGRIVGYRQSMGYTSVYVGSLKKSVLAHRLIWEAVNGEIPPGIEVNHIDGIKTNNRIANLEAVTPNENVRHSVVTGLMPKGRQKVNAKLTDDAVRDIRACDLTNQALSEKYGVCIAVISEVRSRKRWSHVQ